MEKVKKDYVDLNITYNIFHEKHYKEMAKY